MHVLCTKYGTREFLHISWICTLCKQSTNWMFDVTKLFIRYSLWVMVTYSAGLWRAICGLLLLCKTYTFFLWNHTFSEIDIILAIIPPSPYSIARLWQYVEQLITTFGACHAMNNYIKGRALKMRPLWIIIACVLVLYTCTVVWRMNVPCIRQDHVVLLGFINVPYLASLLQTLDFMALSLYM